MPFPLRMRQPGPNLSRVLGTEEPASAPSPARFAFWRGACLGFISAMVVFDMVLLHGEMLGKVGFAIRYAAWFLVHTVYG